MPTIVIGADTSQVASNIETFNQSLISSGKVVGDFANKTLEYNKASQAFIGSIEQMTVAGQKVVRTYEITANSVEQVGVSNQYGKSNKATIHGFATSSC